MLFFNYLNKKQDEEHNITFITYDLLEVMQKFDSIYQNRNKSWFDLSLFAIKLKNSL